MENNENAGQVNQPQNPVHNTVIGGQQSLPNSGGILAMGIISIAVCWCYGIVGIALGIISLVLGNKALKLYKENPSLYTESSYKNANAGRICGIIGLCLSCLCIVFFIIYFLIVGSLIFSAIPFMR